MNDVIRQLIAAGCDAETIAKAKLVLRVREPRAASNEPCPACGRRAMRNDYTCGHCSKLKAERPKLFWQYTSEREQGKQGRPLEKD